MTKEEFYDECYEVYKARDCIDLIDEIFNEFENRICKNCKYRTITPNGKLICLNKNEITKKIVLEIYDDFGCNNFERK